MRRSERANDGAKARGTDGRTGASERAREGGGMDGGWWESGREEVSKGGRNGGSE